MIRSISHMYQLVKWGVYFGYSDESVVQFVVDFGNTFEEIDRGDGNIFIDYRTHGCTWGTGHVCSTYEAVTKTYQEIVDAINLKRYHAYNFPIPDDGVVDTLAMSLEVEDLFSTNFKFRKKVEELVFNIITAHDVTIEGEVQ